MLRRILLAAIIAPFGITSAFASAPIIGMTVGSTVADVIKSLEGLGYVVDYAGMDDGLIEADLRDINGVYDIFIDPETGLILTVEVDEDNDGDA